MAIYWHPYLTQLIRLSYDDRLRIEEEVPLGEMPLRLDILLYPRVLVQELPFPFCCLGGQTIIEYKGPDDTGEHSDLVQLEIYALMYQRRKQLWQRFFRNTLSRISSKSTTINNNYVSSTATTTYSHMIGIIDKFTLSTVSKYTFIPLRGIIHLPVWR